MGRKRDQHYDAETFRRTDTGNDAESALPPPYTEGGHITPSTLTAAPALPPRQASVAASPRKRKLLLVYIHGFTGNETSFQAFPTHVHESISNRLAETHTVQSIVYPKLREHESNDTDVVLLGHSMGGLLAAEVALLPLASHSAIPLRHHILGTVNLDVPFLGVHPGIITSGISSLFRKGPSQSDGSKTERLMTPNSSVDLPEPFPSPSQLEDTSASTAPPCSSSLLPSMSSLSPDSEDAGPGPPDPTISEQGMMSRAIYFINKHSDGLTKATKSYLTSHIEFGSCLADYKGLIERHSRIRALEDNPRSRVRFVNYYTASTGRPKKQKLPHPVEDGVKPMGSSNSSTSLESELRGLNLSASDTGLQHLRTRASIDVEQDNTLDPSIIPSQDASDAESSRASEEKTLETSGQSSSGFINPTTHDSRGIPSSTAVTTINPNSSDPSTTPSIDPFPPLPTLPTKPPPFDSTSYTDKDALKIASRDHDRAMKAYNRLLKDRDSAIKDRRKLLAKRAKATAKEQQKAAKGKGKLDGKPDSPIAAENNGNPNPTREGYFDPPLPTTVVQTDPTEIPAAKVKSPKPHTQSQPPKYRPFCLLPHQVDPTWIRVVMRDVDEIDAHCGLFVREGDHYEGFVREVVERICAWVEDGGR
ncbi:MAG: hypothetical protein Q9186_000895 [Xanthomendoza sp. 1 TL-2023]